MSLVKLLMLLSLLLVLNFRTAYGEEEEVVVVVVGSDGSDSSSSFKIELDELKTKIKTLELSVNEKTRELKDKAEVIAEKEKIIEEKSDNIASLHGEITSLQEKGSLGGKDLVQKAHAHSAELEKQVENLNREIEAKTKDKVALQALANEAEKKVLELNMKLEDLQKIIDEQNTKFRKTERALQIAEEEMKKAKFVATSKSKELMEVHGAWLPPWLAVHLIHCQSFVKTHWKNHGKPALDIVMQKALEKKAQSEKWAEPHWESIKNKCIPAVKEQWLSITTYVEPHVQSLSAKSIELYEASKRSVTPHLIKAKELVDPYFQEAKKFSKPYIDQVATATKPHVDNVRGVLQPYMVVHSYGKCLESASSYHQRVQETVHVTLKKHDLLRPLATKEFVWFAASALLALPIIILCRVFSAICCKKGRKPNRNGNSTHGRGKAKREHPDKQYQEL